VIQVLPFCGWRFDLSQVGALSEVLAPAACEIDETLQRTLYRLHPCNTVRLVSNRDEPGDTSTADRLTRADDFFRLWRKEGILLREHETAFYIVETRYRHGTEDKERWSIFGQLGLATSTGEPATPVTMQKPEPSEIQASLEMRRVCHADFSPVVALVENATADAVLGSLSEYAERLVRQSTPVECFLEHGIRHRIWAVTSEAAKNQLTQRLSASQISLVSGTAQFHAAQQHFAQLKAAGQSSDPNDPAGRLLTCFIAADDPGLEFLPGFFRVPCEGQTGPQLREAAGQITGLQCRFVGNEVYAAADALELAALNDEQPCLAVGTGDGEWQLLSAPARCRNPLELTALLCSEVLRCPTDSVRHFITSPDPTRQGRPQIPPVGASEVLLAASAFRMDAALEETFSSVIAGLRESDIRIFPGIPSGLVFSAHWDRVSFSVHA
jgi:hypothetical protein